MQLVKDIQDSRVVYYWRKAGETSSPPFVQLNQARNWLVSQIWSNYTGTERRKVVEDRRRDKTTSTLFSNDYSLKRQRPKGRRMTDLIEAKVSLDLCPIRLEAALHAS
jgi:hypothetical protein